jgi:hypothetical protein
VYPCDGCHDVNTVCVLFLGILETRTGDYRGYLD